MRILFEDNEPIKTVSIREVNEIDLCPVWQAGGSDVPISVFLEFDGESIAEYPMDGTMDTFNDAVTAYNTIMKALLITGYCSITDFGAELLF